MVFKVRSEYHVTDDADSSFHTYFERFHWTCKVLKQEEYKVSKVYDMYR